jgi:hypothetical protein
LNEEEMMEPIESQIREMEAELQQWGVRLDKLVAKVDGFRTDGKLDYRSRLDNLSQKYAAAEARLIELKTAGTQKWDAYKGGVENAWTELATAFTRLSN